MNENGENGERETENRLENSREKLMKNIKIRRRKEARRELKREREGT